MNLETHCKDCVDKLGKEYREVHIFLDQFFNIFGPDHRKIYHCVEGLVEIKEKFGDEGVEAAKIHILRDFEGDFDYIPTKLDVEKWYTKVYLGIGDYPL